MLNSGVLATTLRAPEIFDALLDGFCAKMNQIFGKIQKVASSQRLRSTAADAQLLDEIEDSEDERRVSGEASIGESHAMSGERG